MPDIFISYSRDDQAMARRYAEGFERAGFSVWWDVTLKSGQAYDRVTEAALRDAKAVVVLWSKRSVNSDWVRAEATIGLRNKTLTPVMIEDCVRPVMFELTQTADLTHWQGNLKDTAWLNFVADVRHIVNGEHLAPAASITPTPGKRATPAISKNINQHHTVKFAGVALAAVVILGAAYWFTRGASPAPASTTPNASKVVDNDAIPNTIAVLPFANLSPDANDAYFATGLHDEILNELTKLSKLKVISRQSVLRFADTKLSTPEIGKELRAANIMAGTVRFSNNRIRVTAQLVDAKSDETLWSNTFDLNFSDIFDAETEIAMNVANAMRVSFTEEERANLAKAPTKSPEAYALYLQAVNLGNTVAFGNSAAMEHMQQLLDQAIAADPGFAQAYLQKAFAYSSYQQVALARENIRKAQALDPTLFSADMMEIRLLLGELKYAQALPLADEMLTKHPNDPVALGVAYDAHAGTYDLTSALQIAQRLFELDKTPASYNTLGAALSRLGRNEEAVPYYQKTVELSPGSATSQIELAYSLAAAGRTEEAVRWITSVKNIVLGANEENNAGGNLYSALIYANALAGRDAEAKRLFAKFKQKAEANSDLPTKARAYIGAGELEQALALLKQMIADKSVNTRNSVNAVRMLKLNPHHLPALERPEFADLRKQL